MAALRGQQERQARERAGAGAAWQEHGLVFTTSVGTGYESHNLRRDFRLVTAAAGLGARWVPKELRTSFVSMMSYQSVPVEEIARLAGHASSRTTEMIYRRELRPVITTRRRGHGPAPRRLVLVATQRATPCERVKCAGPRARCEC